MGLLGQRRTVVAASWLLWDWDGQVGRWAGGRGLIIVCEDTGYPGR